MMKTLVIVAHQDDEALSSGCLILDRVRRGNQVMVVSVYGRVYDYGKITVEKSFEQEHPCFLNAKRALGYQDHLCLNLQEGEPAQVGYYTVLRGLETTLKVFNPDEVIIPSNHDLNQDHRFLHDICRIALRPVALPPKAFMILAAQAFDRSHVQPNWFLAHSNKDMDSKLAAIACYEKEARVYPHPRSPLKIRAQHEVWGGQCHAGLAEAYELILHRA
jgi:LmbE family N-acetylglucosaminyl deacetylase